MRTLAIKNIAEVRMKRQWNVRRQFQPATNAERRCDQAYQHLLEWTLPIDPVPDQLASFRPPPEVEVRSVATEPPILPSCSFRLK